jgi:hypothetical protein
VKVLFYLFTKKYPALPSMGRCNEEETVREKERKERKESKAKQRKRQEKKTKENKWLARDRQTGTWLLFICLFICNQMVGVGFCLVQFSESLGTFFGDFLIFGAFSRGAGFRWFFGF